MEISRTGKCILNPACHKFFAKLHLLSNISKTNIGMQLCGKKGKFMTWNLPKAIRQHWLLLRQNVVQTRKLTKNCTEISSSYCVSHHKLLYELRLTYNKTMKIFSVNGETCHNEESPVSICYTKYPHRKNSFNRTDLFSLQQKSAIYTVTVVVWRNVDFEVVQKILLSNFIYICIVFCLKGFVSLVMFLLKLSDEDHIFKIRYPSK